MVKCVVVRGVRVLFVVAAVSLLSQSICSAAPALEFFDGLRHRTSDDVKAVTETGSSVVQVTVQESNTSESEEYRLCHLTSIIPISNGIGEINFHNGISPNAAALMAVVHFNQKNASIVPELAEDVRLQQCNVRLTISFEDSQFSATKASAALIERALPKRHAIATPKPCGIMGEVRSAVSAPLSVMAGVHHIPVVSYRSTSTKLNNKDMFEFFSRTVTDDSMTAMAAATYIRDVYNVTHCGILFIRDEFGTEFHKHFLHAAHSLDPPMRVASASYDWPCDGGACDKARGYLSTAMELLVKSEYNFFIGVMGTNSKAGLAAIADIGYDLNIYGPGKYWLLAEPPTATRQPSFFMDAVSQGNAARGLHGWNWLSLDIPKNDVFTQAYSDLVTTDAFKDMYLSKQRQAIDVPDEFDLVGAPYQREYFAYEAIMALGIGACNARENFFDGREHLASLRNSSFHGASGPVEFDRTTGTRLYPELPFKVINFVANTADSDGRITFTQRTVSRGVPKGGANIFSWEITLPTVYADNSTEPPPVLPPFAEKTVQVPLEILVVGIFFSAFLLALPAALLGWTAYYRRHRIVQMSQPRFLVMLCIGALVMASCMIPRFLQERAVSDVGCMAVPWLYSMGYVISVSALFSKVSRLRKIHDKSRSFRRITVGYVDVLKPFLLLLGITVALLALWSIVDPLKAKQVTLASVDKFGRSTEHRFICTSSKDGGNSGFFFAILSIQLCALFIAARQLHKARSVISDFDEGHSIVMSIASVFQTTLLTFPTLLIETTDPTVQYVVHTALLTLVTCSVLLPIFIPKIAAVKNRKMLRKMESLRRDLKGERFRRAELVQQNLNLQSELDRVIEASEKHAAKLRPTSDVACRSISQRYSIFRVLRPRASTAEGLQEAGIEDHAEECRTRPRTSIFNIRALFERRSTGGTAATVRMSQDIRQHDIMSAGYGNFEHGHDSQTS